MVRIIAYFLFACFEIYTMDDKLYSRKRYSSSGSINLTGLSLVFKDDICDNYKELLQKYSYDDTSYKIFYEERIIYGSKYTIVM